jgi:hypothetical protein
MGRPIGVVSVMALLSASVAAGPYEDCILANMRGVQDRAAAFAVRLACETKTTPKKCRDAELQKPFKSEVTDVKTGATSFADLIRPAPEYIEQLKAQCLAECSKASYWSRSFGECSID